MVPTEDAIRDLPKLEMHVHLEGNIPLATIADLAERAGEPLPRPLESLYATDNLADFLECLDWVCGLVRDEQTARELAHGFARYCREQGIVYAELIVNPTHWSGLDAHALIGALDAGFDEAAREGLPEVYLLPSLLRQQSAEQALALVEWLGGANLERVVGLSIDGNEAAAGRTGERFAPAFARARELGLGCTAHAGESSGPEGILDALECLRVSRIDHGIRAVEMPGLPERLARERITLNVCVSSNVALVYGDIAAHPLPDLVAAGVPVTLSTDDPVILGIDLVAELARVASHMNWGLDRLLDLQRNAVAASFAPAPLKEALYARLEAYEHGLRVA